MIIGLDGLKGVKGDIGLKGYSTITIKWLDKIK